MEEVIVGPRITKIEACTEGIHKVDVEIWALKPGRVRICFEEKEWEEFRKKLLEVDFESLFEEG